ncbi:hypothetical protein LZF95_15415 [Algoriphagus sp. AGSA1]|uniref:hypothetical protein n=1 Tax=Algoriphagus sp. AGSA1 TaxID=2907213 RepID=UPI001F1E0CB0|nr:hypothetical protein [Algoriphagus sp. AGSA1]MCE7056070.1 hypothetical protein [Algoriphagus sp. AGSA1]
MMPVPLFSLLYWTEDRRRVTEVTLTLVFSESYYAFIVLLEEKRIYILKKIKSYFWISQASIIKAQLLRIFIISGNLRPFLRKKIQDIDNFEKYNRALCS